MDFSYLPQCDFWYYTHCGNFRLTDKGMKYFQSLPLNTGPHKLPAKCHLCTKVFKNKQSMVTHIKVHGIDKICLTIDLFFNGVIPTCLICKSNVVWRGVEQGFKTLCLKCDKLRSISIVAKNRTKNYKPAWNAGETAETNDSVKRGTENMANTLSTFGAWNRGLSLETHPENESLQLLSKNTSKGLQTYYETHDGIFLGETSATNEIIRLRGLSIKNAFQEKSLRDRFTPEGLEAARANGRRMQAQTAINQRLSEEELNKRINAINDKWEQQFLTVDVANLQKPGEAVLEFKCVKCGFIAKHMLFTFTNGKVCSCQKPAYSIAEGELVEFIKQHENNVITNNSTLISPWELDVVVPEKKIALEFNGLYWHSEAKNKKSRWYHENKRILCLKNDYRLFHVYEDEWLNKQPIVKSMILNRLGYFQNKIHARKCVIKVFEKPSKLKKFFNDNHIDGYVNVKLGFALEFNGEIVSAITLRNPLHKTSYPGTIEIARFATKLNTVVNGGFSKLFKAITEWSQQQNFKQILSYKDNRFGGTTSCYEISGMTHVKTTSASWWWTDFSERANRFKFKTTNGVNEKIIANQAGYHRIGGCTNDVFVYNL